VQSTVSIEYPCAVNCVKWVSLCSQLCQLSLRVQSAVSIESPCAVNLVTWVSLCSQSHQLEDTRITVRCDWSCQLAIDYDNYNVQLLSLICQN